MKKIIVEEMNFKTSEGQVLFYKNEEEALTYAYMAWANLTEKEKENSTITVAKCTQERYESDEFNGFMPDEILEEYYKEVE